MRTVLALALVSTVVGACGSCSEEVAPGPEVDRSPAPPPDGLLWEARITGGATTFGAARELVPDSALRLAVARSPGAAMERLAPDLDVADRIPEDAPVHAVGIRDDEGRGRIVAACPIEAEEGPEALGPGVTLTPGAPRGGRFVGRAPDDDDEAVVVVDGVLVLGETRAALEAALPYLAFTLVPDTGGDDGVRVRAPAGAPGNLRAVAEEAWHEQATRLRRAAEAERARHDEAPHLGDPEAALDVLSATVTRWLAMLPDVGETTATATLHGGALSITVDADVRADSPLSRELAGMVAGSPHGVAALPDSTAVAAGWRSRREGNLALVEPLERIAGERLDEADRAAVRGVARSWRDARGDGLVVAAGAEGREPWALLATAGGNADVDVDLEGVLGVDYVRTVLAALLGCGDDLAVGRAVGGQGWVAQPLCGGEEPPRMLQASDGGARVLRLVGSATGESPRGDRARSDLALARRLARGERGPLGQHPDVQRALGAADEVLLAVVVVPERILDAAAVLAAGPARGGGGGGSGAPVVFTIERTQAGLRARLTVARGAITGLVGLVLPLFSER